MVRTLNANSPVIEAMEKLKDHKFAGNYVSTKCSHVARKGFLGFPNVMEEAEPSAIRPRFSGNNSWIWEEDTGSLFKIGVKPSFLIKAYIEHKNALSYTVIG